ncbi:hypothetical protein BST21_06160, partial [Mycolicibacterium celeriflavum]
MSGLTLWLLWPDPPAPVMANPPATTTATSPTDSSTGPRARLSGVLPAGYPPGSCKPVRVPDTATAAMACCSNTDPGGPTSATYILARDLNALRAAFNNTVDRSTTVICPPNIQSPVLCPTGVSKTVGGIASA